MQKTLIIYKSETGFTQKYAKWLSNELQAWDDDEGFILMLKNKQPEFCEIISKSFDASDFSYLDGLVECVRGM